MSLVETAASPRAAEMGFDGGLTCAMSCTDRKASIKWYEEMLGFTLLYDMDEIGWCEMSTPAHR